MNGDGWITSGSLPGPNSADDDTTPGGPGSGDDTLFGDSGDDTIPGGSGDDITTINPFQDIVPDLPQEVWLLAYTQLFAYQYSIPIQRDKPSERREYLHKSATSGLREYKPYSSTGHLHCIS